MTIAARRFLVAPDDAFTDATVVSCESTSGARQEAGIRVAQPTRDPAASPVGDIACTLSGEPEVHVEGDIVITRGGVVEDARWGWVREGDDATKDLQFRQSPHVVGRRVDCVEGLVNDPPSEVSGRAVRPRLLVLVSGDVLMVWTWRTWMPIWARNGSSGTESIRYSVLDHATDTWAEPAYGPIPFDVTGGGAYISAVDVTQFPDTGEIVMCVATSNSMTPASVDPRIMFVYSSLDDGASWILKHRLHMDGPIPDILLDTDGDGDIDDNTAVQDWALELLDSGRLCLFTVTEDYTWSLTSDDRGASWSATLVHAHVGDYTYAGHGVGAGKARNGMAMFIRALRSAPTGAGALALSLVGVRFTRDGVSWSSGIQIPRGQVIYETVDVAVCMSPDGWPHIYGTEHASKLPGLEEVRNPQDWLWGRRLTTRDPSLVDTTDTVVPTGPSEHGPAAAFHLSTGLAEGSYGVPALAPFDPATYRGFVGLDAVMYRGQVLIAVVAQRDGTQPATDTQAPLGMYGLMVYRLNHWQPAQERVADAHQLVAAAFWYEPAWPAIGRIYNETWDCYDVPDEWGWTKTGAVVPVLTYAGAEGGYMAISGAPVYWQRPVSAGQAIGMAANLRIVVHVESGGASGSDTIAVRLALSDSVSRSDVSIRFKRNGANVEIYLYDNTNGAFVGSAIVLDADTWTEVLYAQHRETNTSNVNHYLLARRYIRATDPDWDGPYTTGTLTASTVGGAAGGPCTLRFGHVVSGDPETWWKSVHLARAWTKSSDPQVDEKCALVRAANTYLDNDATNDRSTEGTGEPPLDNGLDNWMRTSRTLAEPRQYMERGVNTAFRGEAVGEGMFDYAAGYAYAARNMLVQPVLLEWRSVDDSAAVAIVLRSPDPCGFRPDALAVFGHNLSAITVQFNTANSWTFGVPVTAVYGLPNVSGLTVDRYIHEWAFNSAAPAGLEIDIYDCRLIVKGTPVPNPWRPHQFKSDLGGQTHYCAIHEASSGTVYVFRILDNAANVLELETEPSTVGIDTTGKDDYNVSIFSDRFAVMIGHFLDAASSPSVGYEYCRIVARATTHADVGAEFARIGRIVLGTTIELSTPDFERGWSIGFEDGSLLVEQPTGAAYTHRQRPVLRTWQADQPWMFAPPEASAVNLSPSSQPERATWARWLDATRRIDGSGVACALVWEGERFVGFDGEEAVQVCADPIHLAMCHVVGLGDLENLVYDGVNENLAGGAECVPRPVSHIRGLRFRETL